MIAINEARVHNCQMRWAETLYVTLEIKKEDYQETGATIFFDAKLNGDCFAVVMSPIDEQKQALEEKKERNKLLAELEIRMQEYARENGIPYETLKQRIYLKHKVTSRSQLSNAILREEIDLHKLY